MEAQRLPLNRSTVYRTLETLAEIGVLRGTRMGRAVHYEVAGEDDEHHHVRCVRCHKMVHLEARQVDRLLRRLAAEEDFEVIDVQLLVAGLCAGCREAARP
ncbi:MAG: Fur family transcriptional regulator, ferric uptake regulator [Chloroflexota bacterium]|nr:Fur family transcriptional regulator, ferric uptake regulator [Chloroflexota bacterium]